MGERRPVHLLAEAGDRRSLCGERDPLPRCLDRHADDHVAGYGMPICPACAAKRATRTVIQPEMFPAERTYSQAVFRSEADVPVGSYL